MNKSDFLILTTCAFFQSHKAVNTIESDGTDSYIEMDSEIIKMSLKNGMNPLGLMENGILVTELFPQLMKMAYNDKELDDLIWESISTESLQRLSQKQTHHILKPFLDDYEITGVKKLFDKGLRIEQGTELFESIEIDMAAYLHSEFFTILSGYQPDFDYEHEYNHGDDKMTIKEYLKANKNVAPEHNQNLIELLEKLEMNQKLQKELKILSATRKAKI